MKRLLACLAAMILLLCGCGESTGTEETSGDVFLYYVNEQETKVVSKAIELESTNEEDVCNELISRLFLQPLREQEETGEKQYLLPENVELQEHWVDDDQVLWLSFNKNYNRISRQQEILIRASVVRTLVQTPGIEYVGIMVEDKQLKDSYGEKIPPMNEEFFVENSGKEINSYQKAEMTLYFTNADGTALCAEERSRYYTTNMPLERVVVEELVKGPKTAELYATIPSETKILGVTVADNVCYVNLSAEFSDVSLNLQEDIPIYSIVNSLTALGSVDSVQISIDENTNRVYREKINLDQMFKANPELVEE